MSVDNKIIQRQVKGYYSQSWEHDNFSGLYTGSNSTLITAYWRQNLTDVSGASVGSELVVLFQSEGFTNGVTQVRQNWRNTANISLLANNFSFSATKGSILAISPANDTGEPVLFYTIDESNQLQQHEYRISDPRDPNIEISPLSTISRYLYHKLYAPGIVLMRL